jgi:hypothetical protein
MQSVHSETATEISTVRYSDSEKDVWDNWIKTAKNGHFMFFRNYMDYHRDRYADHSLMFFEKDNLVAVLPANVKDQTLLSHGGLTFGGLVIQESMRAPCVVRVFDSLINYLCEHSVRHLRYKAIPYIYQTIPGDEDLYALFRHNARLVRRDASSTIRMDYRLAYSKGRKYSLKLAQKNGVVIKESKNFETFMALESEVLARKHNTRPVHTHQEISLLANRFPNNIKLFTAHRNDELLAGVITYESQWVHHAQYMAASEKGKAVGALDIIVDTILKEMNNSKRYFDFGISTESEGRILNEGLISQKEMFGARTVLYDTYELEVR